jgi:hypothetical protein
VLLTNDLIRNIDFAEAGCSLPRGWLLELDHTPPAVGMTLSSQDSGRGTAPLYGAPLSGWVSLPMWGLIFNSS